MSIGSRRRRATSRTSIVGMPEIVHMVAGVEFGHDRPAARGVLRSRRRQSVGGRAAYRSRRVSRPAWRAVGHAHPNSGSADASPSHRQRFGRARSRRASSRAAAWPQSRVVERAERDRASRRFSRRLVERIMLDARVFVERSAELFRLAPIRNVILADVGGRLDGVLAVPQLAQLVSLEFGSDRAHRIGDAGVAKQPARTSRISRRAAASRDRWDARPPAS